MGGDLSHVASSAGFHASHVAAEMEREVAASANARSGMKRSGGG